LKFGELPGSLASGGDGRAGREAASVIATSAGGQIGGASSSPAFLDAAGIAWGVYRCF